MTGWLIEHGIGETRAARMLAGGIAEMRIRRADDGVEAGEIWDARFVTKLSARRGIVRLADEDALIEPLPVASEGGIVRVEVVREAIPERGRPRLAKVVARGAAGLRPGRVAQGPGWPAGRVVDAIDGWDDAIGEAEAGVVGFDGGALTLSPTPAMTLIDVDGDLEPAALVLAGARAAAAAIMRFDIGGSIGVDLPTVRDRAVRAEAAALFDSVLPPPFERTAVNGFGFIHIVRPRPRASILERVHNAPVATAALALLRLAARSPGHGRRTLTARADVVDWLQRRPALVDALKARLGCDVALAADAALTLHGGHVHATQA
jgi:hypothetical protein